MQPASDEEMFEQWVDKMFTTMKRGDPLRPHFWKRTHMADANPITIIPVPDYTDGVETDAKFISDWTQWVSDNAR